MGHEGAQGGMWSQSCLEGGCRIFYALTQHVSRSSAVPMSTGSCREKRTTRASLSQLYSCSINRVDVQIRIMVCVAWSWELLRGDALLGSCGSHGTAKMVALVRALAATLRVDASRLLDLSELRSHLLLFTTTALSTSAARHILPRDNRHGSHCSRKENS